MGFFNTILNIIFPVKCLSCGESGSDLCLSCVRDFPPAERETAKWIFPLFDYRHPPIKKTLWLLKYKGKKRISLPLAELLYGRILEELSDLSVMENFSSPLLLPVPLSKKRYKERGYNQSELICRELIKRDSSKNFELAEKILLKPHETKHQARIENRTERLKNIVGSFAVKNAEQVKNRNLILIDDITTTGATLSEARKVLKEAGAKKIIAFTVAH